MFAYIVRRIAYAIPILIGINLLREGLDIPASLHPIIDAERCIGTGSCLAACPEQDILGLKSGQAVLAALQAQGVYAHGVDVRRDILQVLEQGAYDRAFVILQCPGHNF